MINIKIKSKINIARDVENIKFDGNCPKCGNHLSATLSQMSREETIKCDKCFGEICLKDDGGKEKEILKEYERLDILVNSLGK